MTTTVWETGFEVDPDTGIVAGEATWKFEEYDGLPVTFRSCTLAGLRLGGLELSRDKVVQMLGEAWVDRLERITLEGMQEDRAAAWPVREAV